MMVDEHSELCATNRLARPASQVNLVRAQTAVKRPQQGTQTQTVRDLRLAELAALACVRQLPCGLVFAMGA